jgi:hypothetical protein
VGKNLPTTAIMRQVLREALGPPYNETRWGTAPADTSVTFEQLAEASGEPIERLRAMALAGVVTFDEFGWTPLWPSMRAIVSLKGEGKLPKPVD